MSSLVGVQGSDTEVTFPVRSSIISSYSFSAMSSKALTNILKLSKSGYFELSTQNSSFKVWFCSRVFLIF